MSVGKKQLAAIRGNARQSVLKTEVGEHVAALSTSNERHAFNILRYEMRPDCQLTCRVPRACQLLNHLQSRGKPQSGEVDPQKTKKRENEPILV